MDGGKSSIPTSLRLLTVIEEIARAGGPITPTEANARLGLPKPTIHRLFATLEAEGFVQRDLDGRGFGPGPRLRTLAAGVLSSQTARAARQAILQRLSADIGETCNIALPDGDAMIYLERVETHWPLRIQLPIGTRVPLHCTASGKMYLSSLTPAQLRAYLGAGPLPARTQATITDPAVLSAELSEVRAEGRAFDREEFMEGMIAVAVPVTDAEGRLVATLSAHAPDARLDLGRAAGYLPALRAAAAELGALVSG